MVDAFLEEFVEFGDLQLLLLPLLDDLVDLLEAALARVDGAHDLLDEGGLLCNFRELVLDVLQYLHGVVLAVEDLRHDLHVAVGDGLLVPQLFQIGERLVNRLLLPLLVAPHIGLVADFV